MSETLSDLFMRFTSRKFLLALLGVVIVFSKRFGVELTGEEIAAITALIVGYNVSEGAVDVAQKLSERTDIVVEEVIDEES